MLGFDVASVQYHKKLDKYQGKKISLLAQLYYTAYSISIAADASQQNCALKKSTSVARSEMMKLATIQTYPYFSLMTWLIFLQNAQIWDCLPSFFTVVTANVYSLGLSGNGKKLTCWRTTEMNTDEIWKCNFPSANHLLKAQVNHQSGKSFARSSSSFRAFYLIDQIASLIKLLDFESSLDRVSCFSPLLYEHSIAFSQCATANLYSELKYIASF